MSRALLAPLAVVPAARPVAGRYVDGFACRLCGAFAPRHLPLTHAADCRERNALVIAIYQRTASGVVRADTATTVAESHARLRALGAPAVAFDGSVFVAAAGGTSEADLRAIAAVATAGAEPEARSCAWPGCCAAVARVREMTPIGLVGFCGAHRRLIYECSRPVDTDDPDAVAQLVAAVGPAHCSKDRCPWCRADLRRAVAELTRRVA